MRGWRKRNLMDILREMRWNTRGISCFGLEAHLPGRYGLCRPRRRRLGIDQIGTQESSGPSAVLNSAILAGVVYVMSILSLFHAT